MLILRLAIITAGIYCLRLRPRIPLEVCDIPGEAEGATNGKTAGRKTADVNESDCQEVRGNGEGRYGAVGPVKIYVTRN